jgi:hypothetical protein
MRVATFTSVGVGVNLISVAHHTTVPIRPLPSVAVTMDDVVLVSGPVGVKVGKGGELAKL